MNDFDRIAWCYEPLKQLVFGNRLEEASGYHLPLIRSGSEVLILGGGTGKILNALPNGLRITYLEKSGKMIEMAKKHSDPEITFVHTDFLQYRPTQEFDYVICPFFLDVFDEVALSYVIVKINQILKNNGNLLVIDLAGKEKLLIRLMYLFFKYSSQIQANKLPPIHEEIIRSGFKLERSDSFYDGSLFSNWYRN